MLPYSYSEWKYETRKRKELSHKRKEGGYLRWRLIGKLEMMIVFMELI